MRFLRNSVIVLAALAALIWANLNPGEPSLYPAEPGAPTYDVHVVDHGWHTGLIVSTDDIASIALRLPEIRAEEASLLLSLARIMAAAEWVEIGWGDAEFYQADVAGPMDVPLSTIIPSLFIPTETVLHIFPGLGPPEEAFPASDTVRMTLSEPGYEKLALALARDFDAADGLPRDLGAGLYGYARFYAATGRYTALKTCNNWVAERLATAGVPASWVASAFSIGLMTELKGRAGAETP